MQNLKAINLGGKVFWFYSFDPLSVISLKKPEGFEWSFDVH